MGKKLRKTQNPTRMDNRATGIIIDCDEITISVFPPPREHGNPHCHVRSKLAKKTKGKSGDVFPELKVFLDGSGFIIITEGFSERDINLIMDIIFNDVPDGEESNDEYLERKWKEIHDGQC